MTTPELVVAVVSGAVTYAMSVTMLYAWLVSRPCGCPPESRHKTTCSCAGCYRYHNYHNSRQDPVQDLAPAVATVWTCRTSTLAIDDCAWRRSLYFFFAAMPPLMLVLGAGYGIVRGIMALFAHSMHCFTRPKLPRAHAKERERA
jgi:hypothetical protein